jgi:predicted Zn-dependent peptidase
VQPRRGRIKAQSGRQRSQRPDQLARRLLASLTLEQVKTLYKTQVGGQHAELGVVGDLDPQTTLRTVKEMLAG